MQPPRSTYADVFYTPQYIEDNNPSLPRIRSLFQEPLSSEIRQRNEKFLFLKDFLDAFLKKLSEEKGIHPDDYEVYLSEGYLPNAVHIQVDLNPKNPNDVIDLAGKVQDVVHRVFADLLCLHLNIFDGEIADLGFLGPGAFAQFYTSNVTENGGFLNISIRDPHQKDPSHRLQPSLTSKVLRTGYFRDLKSTTEEGKSRDSKKKIPQREGLTQEFNLFLEGVALSKNPLFYKCNALLDMDEANPNRVFFLQEFSKELKKQAEIPGQEPWIVSLQGVFSLAEEKDLVSLLKGLLPLFAQEMNLYTRELQCKIQDAYVVMPLLTESDLNILGKNAHLIREFIPLDLVLVNLKKLPSEISLEIPNFFARLLKADLNTVPTFLEVLSRLRPLFSTVEEQTKVSCGSIRRILEDYKGKLEQVPDFLWEPLQSMIRVINPLPWKKLFMNLLLDFPKQGSESLQNFFDNFFFSIYGTNTEFFDYEANAKSLELVKACFARTHLNDPFSFDRNFSLLLREKKIQQALNLLSYQSAVFGYLSVQEETQRIFFRIVTKPEDRLLYLGVLKEIFKAEKEAKNRFEIALRTYSFLYHMPEVLGLFEEICLFKGKGFLEEVLNRDDYQGGDLKTSYKNALSARIKICTEKKKYKTAFILLKRLAEFGEDRSVLHFLIELSKFYEPKFFASKVHTDFPNHWPDLLKAIKGSSREYDLIFALSQLEMKEEVQSLCCSQLIHLLPSKIPSHNQEILEMMSVFIESMDGKAILSFMQKCIELPPSEVSLDLFRIAAQELSYVQEPVPYSSWSMRSLETCLLLLSEQGLFSEKMAEVLYSQIPPSELKNPKSMHFIGLLFPHLSESLKISLLEKIVLQIHDKIRAKESLKQLTPYFRFIHQEDVASLFFKEGRFRDIRKKLVSYFVGQLDVFEKSSKKPHKDLDTLDLLECFRGVFRNSCEYFLREASDKDRITFFHRFCISSIADPDISKAAKIAAQVENYESLKESSWKQKELIRAFCFLDDSFKQGQEDLQECVQKYVQYALETAQEIPLKSMEHMASYLTHDLTPLYEERLNKTFPQLNNIYAIQDFLYCIAALDIRRVYENGELYHIFIEAFESYLKTENAPSLNQDFLEKIEGLLVVGTILQNEEIGRSEKLLLDCIGLFVENYWTDPNGLQVFEQKQEIISQIVLRLSANDLEEFSKKFGTNSTLTSKCLLIRALIARSRAFWGELEVLRALSSQFDTMPKNAALDLIEFFCIEWARYVVDLNSDLSLPLEELSQCTNTLYQFLFNYIAKTSEDETPIEHAIDMIREKMREISRGSKQGEQFTKYLEFLANVHLKSGETLEMYMQKNSLVCGRYLLELVKLYDKEISNPSGYKKENLVRDMARLELVDNLYLDPSVKPEPEELMEAWKLSAWSLEVNEEFAERVKQYMDSLDPSTYRYCRTISSYLDIIMNKKHLAIQNEEYRVRHFANCLLQCYDEFITYGISSAQNSAAINKFLSRIYPSYVRGFFDSESIFAAFIDTLGITGFADKVKLILSQMIISLIKYSPDYLKEWGELDDWEFNLFLQDGSVDFNVKKTKLMSHFNFLKKIAAGFPANSDQRLFVEERRKKYMTIWSDFNSNGTTFA